MEMPVRSTPLNCGESVGARDVNRGAASVAVTSATVSKDIIISYSLQKPLSLQMQWKVIPLGMTYDQLVCEAAGLDLTCVEATFGSDCVHLERLAWAHDGELLRGRLCVRGRD